MKNIFTRALALTIVFALCAVSAFAAPAFTTVAYDAETGTLDIATNGYTAGKSATVLVVKAGANLANLANTDIVYINQVDNAVADQSYTDIPIAERAAAIGATAVNVYIGGTEAAAAIPYKAEGDSVASITVAEEVVEPVITTAYTATLPAAEYATVEAAIAALVVTKVVTTDGVAAPAETLAASAYTVTANPTAPEANATVTLTVAITADTAATVAPVTFTYKPVITTAYAATVAAGEYTSLDEVKAAAVTVTKTVTTNGVAAPAETLAAGAYTVEYADNAGTVTVTIKVGGEVVATTTATYTAPVEPPVSGGKTAIAGKITWTNRNQAVAAVGATVVITNGANVAGYAVANAAGEYEVELPAGTYRAIVNFIRFNATATYATYAPQVITDIVVTEGATTTKDVTMAAVKKGDIDNDGDVDLDDYNALAGAWTGKIN